MNTPNTVSGALLRAVPPGLDAELRAYLTDAELPDAAKAVIAAQVRELAEDVAAKCERLAVVVGHRATWHRSRAAEAAQRESRAAQRASEAAAERAEGELVTETAEFAQRLGLILRQIEWSPGWWGSSAIPPRRFEVIAPNGHPLVELLKPSLRLLRDGQFCWPLWSGTIEDAAVWLDRAAKTARTKADS